jgi:Domain of unknown function (DUF3850)
MTEHALKTLGPYWEAVASGAKNFEVRRDDRGFQRGDVLVLQPVTEDGRRIGVLYREIRKRVTYVLTGGQFGIEPGYVVMALEDE